MEGKKSVAFVNLRFTSGMGRSQWRDSSNSDDERSGMILIKIKQTISKLFRLPKSRTLTSEHEPSQLEMQSKRLKTDRLIVHCCICITGKKSRPSNFMTQVHEERNWMASRILSCIRNFLKISWSQHEIGMRDEEVIEFQETSHFLI